MAVAAKLTTVATPFTIVAKSDELKPFKALEHPILFHFPHLAECLLPNKNQKDFGLKSLIFPSETTWEVALKNSSKVSSKVLLPFLVEEFYFLEDFNLKQMEDEKAKQFRILVALPVQFRIVLLLKHNFKRIKKDKRRKAVYVDWKSKVQMSPVFSFLPLP